MTAIAKLQPHRSMYMRGFDRRGAAASMHDATASGFTISGCWSDQADFAVAMLLDADDTFGHLHTSRYLPDFSLAGVTLDFDLALTGCMSPISTKYQSVPWGSLSWIVRSVSSGVVTETPGTILLDITSKTGGVQASASFTVAGTPTKYDRVQLVYLGNVVFDFTCPDLSESSSSVSIGYTNFATGYVHGIQVGSATYTYTELSGDTDTSVATGITAAVNAGAGDANAAATSSGHMVILTAISAGSLVECMSLDPGLGYAFVSKSISDVTFAYYNYFGAGYSHYVTIGANTYTHVQLSTDGSSDIATALVALINAGSGDPNALATASANSVILSPRIDQDTSCSASDGNGPGLLSQHESSGNLLTVIKFIAGFVHYISISSASPGSIAHTYTYTEIAGDTLESIATGMAASVNAGTGDANLVAAAGGGPTWCVAFTPKVAGSFNVSSSDGSPTQLSQELLGSSTAFVAAQLAAQINTSGYLTAVASGAAITVSAPLGRDGNGIGLLSMYKTAGSTLLYPTGSVSTASGQVAKLTGGADPTSMHVHLDFSAMGLASVRQLWLTLAPALNYDSGSVTINPSLVAYAPSTFSAVFSNWTVMDPGGVTPLKLAGSGSITVSSSDSWVSRAGPGWAQVAGWYVGGYAWQSAHAGDTVTVTYSCQYTHDIYLGTAVSTVGGTFDAAVDGGAVAAVSAYSLQSSASPTSGRRLIAAGVAAGTHAVVLTVASGTCLFDFLQAAVLSDPVAPGVTYPSANCACDFDTGATYQIPPARLLWTLSQAGFQGDVDFYAGVFFALKRARNGGSFRQCTVTLSGTIGVGNSYGVGADTVWLTVGWTTQGGTVVSGATTTGANPTGGSSIGGTVLGAAAYPADTLATLAQRLVDAVNGTFVGIRAALTVTAGQFTITVLSPIDGFSLDVSLSAGASVVLSVSGDVGALTTLAGGNEGTWSVDSSQASPLNKAFVDYLTDFAAEVAAAGQTMTVAFSQELLGAPDANTSAGAWTQRFASGAQVLTDTGFGLWGAGVVESVSGSGPQTIQQTGHGYITGNTVHVAQGSNGAVWTISVTDADHYQLIALMSGTAFTVLVPSATQAAATTYIDLQTTQCNFNPSTVTAYMEKCYLQAAGILTAAGLVPWLQLGEVGWWFYSQLMNEAIGYASWTSPISIGTVAPHGLSSGETAVVAAVGGTTAANATWPIVVTDGTHFTETGSSGNAAYTSGGTVSGGGMAYYDAYTTAAAATSLGRALVSFWTQDDDPSTNGHADANFLRTCLYTHMHAIAQSVKAAYTSAKIEWLLPMDVNNPTVYWNSGYPYPQGGRMNNYVNIPAQYKTPNGDIDRVKIEALSWGANYLNIDLAKAAMRYGFAVLSYSKSATAYLVPWFNGACAWTSQYLAAVNSDVPLIGFWAVDHLCLLSWPLPLPTSKRRALLAGPSRSAH